MIVIGLTGSIAMGKSEVVKVFRSHAIPVFDADAEVHALYDSPEGAALLASIVPNAIANGKVNRSKLSEAILGDNTLLGKIETVVHAEVAKRRERFLADARSAHKVMAVIDVPLLFEKGYDKDVDVVIVVSTPVDLQRQRALARPGMTEEKLDMILKRQMPDTEKRSRADFVIENDGSLALLRERTEAVIETLRKPRHA